MKYHSVVPLNSARPAGRRVEQFAMSREASDFLLTLGILPGDTVQFAAQRIEQHMAGLNVSQRQEFLKKLGRLVNMKALA